LRTVIAWGLKYKFAHQMAALDVGKVMEGDLGIPESLSWADLSKDPQFGATKGASMRIFGTSLSSISGAERIRVVCRRILNVVRLLSSWSRFCGTNFRLRGRWFL